MIPAGTYHLSIRRAQATAAVLKEKSIPPAISDGNDTEIPNADGATAVTKTCVTLDGKTFEWGHPNVFSPSHASSFDSSRSWCHRLLSKKK